MQTLLALDALSGSGVIATAFSEEADYLGLTPKGRERIEREKDRKANEFAALLREQTEQFLKRIDGLEQAASEALRENEELLRSAREDLERVRGRAYELTAPDGTTEKVYPDGDKVRMESGAEVSPDIVKAEDIGKGHSTWAERTAVLHRQETLQREHEQIINYRKELTGVRAAASRDDISLDDLAALKTRAENNMPQSVRDHLGPSAPNEKSFAVGQNGILASPFNKAVVSGPAIDTPDDINDLKRPRPSASMPAPM